MDIIYHVLDADGIHWYNKPYSREFAPMKELLEMAQLLDKRSERDISFVSPYLDEDPLVFITTDECGLQMWCHAIGVDMTITNSKVTIQLHRDYFDMTHTVKLSKFDSKRILLHFERCVVEAREQTKEFFQKFHTLDYNKWRVGINITSMGAVNVWLKSVIHDEFVYNDVHALHELNGIPIVEIAENAMNERINQQSSKNEKLELNDNVIVPW